NDVILDTEDGWYPEELAQQVFEKSGTLQGAQLLFQVHKSLIEYFLRSVKTFCGPFVDNDKPRVDIVILSGAALVLSEYLEIHNIPFAYMFAQPSHRTSEYPSPLLGLPYLKNSSITNSVS
ncbi:hypothetical protein HK096_001866, partial [Nowakowskiella sp. JEL0078]